MPRWIEAQRQRRCLPRTRRPLQHGVAKPRLLARRATAEERANPALHVRFTEQAGVQAGQFDHRNTGDVIRRVTAASLIGTNTITRTPGTGQSMLVR